MRVRDNLAVPSATEPDSVAERASLIMFRLSLAFGFAALVPAVPYAFLSDGAPLGGFVVSAWCAAWGFALWHADAARGLFRAHPVVVTMLVAASYTVSLAITGGLTGNARTAANWLGWTATVLFTARASLAVAASLTSALIVGNALAGVSLSAALEGPARYQVVTDILNPLILTLVGLALAGVFRTVIASLPEQVLRWRTGESTSTSTMRELLAGPPLTSLPASRQPGVADPAPRDDLTEREREIITLLAAGHTPQEIARLLPASEHTVYRRIQTAKAKCGAVTTAQLIHKTWGTAR